MRSATVLHASLVAVLATVAAACGDEGGTAARSADRTTSATVVGNVTLGPQCPVEAVGEPCPGLPPSGVLVTVSERLPGDAYAVGETVATATTDADGGFTADVPPGEYVVTAQVGMSCEVKDVVALDDEVVHVVVPCDTGIR